MTTYLRRYQNDAVVEQLDVVEDSWDLDDQLRKSEDWLRHHALDKADNGFWALDIGFHKRPVAVPGYTISVDLMRLLVANDVTLWLSLYPGGTDSADV